MRLCFSMLEVVADYLAPKYKPGFPLSASFACKITPPLSAFCFQWGAAAAAAASAPRLLQLKSSQGQRAAQTSPSFFLTHIPKRQLELLALKTADPARELHVLNHDGHALGVDRAEVGVLEEVHQVGLIGRGGGLVGLGR